MYLVVGSTLQASPCLSFHNFSCPSIICLKCQHNIYQSQICTLSLQSCSNQLKPIWKLKGGPLSKKSYQNCPSNLYISYVHGKQLHVKFGATLITHLLKLTVCSLNLNELVWMCRIHSKRLAFILDFTSVWVRVNWNYF
jgi:hypothetical protein